MAIIRPSSDLLVTGWSGNAPEIVTSKQPWRKQPQGAVEIDWSNPITRGLVGAWLPAAKGDVQGTPGYGVGRFGVKRIFVRASSQRISLPLLKPVSVSTTGLTLFAIGGVPIYNVNSGSIVAVSNGTAYASMLYRGEEGSGFAAATWDGSNFRQTHSTTCISNKDYANAAVFNKTGTPGVIYRDGINVTTSTTHAGAFPSSSLTTLNIGSALQSSDYLGGNCYGAMAFNRALSPAEVKSISDNPWQIFKPKKVIQYHEVPKSYKLAEETPNDNDYISASAPGAVARIALGTTTDPGNNDNHRLTYRASSPEGDRGLIARVVEYGNIGIVTSKQPWRKQPQGAVEIDLSLVKHKPICSVLPHNMARERRVGRHGVEYVFNEALSQYNNVSCVGGIGNGYTFVAVVNPTGTDSSYSNIFNVSNASVNIFQCRHTTTTWDFYHQRAAGTWDLAQWPYTSGPQVIVGRWSGTTLYAYANGLLKASTAANAVVNGSATVARIGADAYVNFTLVSGSYWEGGISGVFVFNYDIGDALAKSLSANPWQIFKPQKRISYFDAPKLIATRTPTLTTTPADYTIDLSSGEAGLITDYSKLGVEFEST